MAQIIGKFLMFQWNCAEKGKVGKEFIKENLLPFFIEFIASRVGGTFGQIIHHWGA